MTRTQRHGMRGTMARGVTLLTWLLCALPVVAGCKTAAGDQNQAAEAAPAKPPVIYANMPLNEALTAAMGFGGETLEAVKRLVRRRQEAAAAAALLEKTLTNDLGSLEPHQLLNTGHLYAAFAPAVTPELVRTLIHAERRVVRQLGWQLAALRPDRRLVQVLDLELSRAVTDGEEAAVMLPQMANAVRANNMKSSYTLVRQGLMTQGDEEYAQALIALDPARATGDLMDYLAMAPAEELRQLTLSSVNLYTCMAALRHFKTVRVNPGQPAFGHLFLYAVSRNTALAEMAHAVLEGFVPERTELLAQLLARHPAWVQLAFIEGARRRSTTGSGLLLSELKNTTTEHDVAAEIDQIKF